ncbi:flp pilus-assembly TadE/G-like family protein [Micromonospora sp. ALFpr18c]|uniref:Rv3654c family TadE-like protein n=1 Tax=Micromonospora sp. ALFpr18c TaxID=1458665 RepID=UPI00124B1E2D|nr:flp pilus-assembly TadE/G-like family protein [Micromonospora sp. ALFpr18c]
MNHRATDGPRHQHRRRWHNDRPDAERRDTRSQGERLEGGRSDGDRGGATVVLLAVGLVFVLVGTFGAAVAVAAMAAQRAAVAADLGALAGAGKALDGDVGACASALDVVDRNGGRLVACRLDGLDVLVTVEVAVTPLPGLTRVAVSTARAGPVRG